MPTAASARRPRPIRATPGGAPPDHAYRRDRSTLQSRLDRRRGRGAAGAPADLAPVGVAAGDPARADRRHRRLGADAARRRARRRRGRAEPVPARSAATPAGAARAAAPRAAPKPLPLAARATAHPTPERARRPARRRGGARAASTSSGRGRAADDQTLRAASNERTRAHRLLARRRRRRPTAARDGRGPGERAGAVARPAAGTAPAVFGAPEPAGARRPRSTSGRSSALRALQAGDPAARAATSSSFPKPLALRLEQGETDRVLRRSASTGGSATGPRVVKSSGFEEFDSAAVRAVRRAAPFPADADPSATPLSVSMPVTFDNPVIR